MAFWGEGLNASSKDPKRKFKFKVQIGDLGQGIVWYAKSVTKPEMTIENGTEHKFMGHTYKFPGSVKWNECEVMLVDPVDDNGKDAATRLLEIIEKSGYVFPNELYKDPNQPRAFETISKGKATAALQAVVIEQIDSDGNTIEKWTLHNPFINKVGFGDLSYDSEDLSEISLGITYDWATFNDNQTPTIFDRPLS
jgi:hypothetical protein